MVWPCRLRFVAARKPFVQFKDFGGASFSLRATSLLSSHQRYNTPMTSSVVKATKPQASTVNMPMQHHPRS